MKLPFVSRASFDLLHRVSEAQLATIKAQNEQILILKQQAEELKGLFSKTTNFEVVEQSETGLKLKLKDAKAPIVAGRGAWRARRAMQESRTREIPNDSVAALEQRVAEAARGNN